MTADIEVCSFNYPQYLPIVEPEKKARPKFCLKYKKAKIKFFIIIIPTRRPAFIMAASCPSNSDNIIYNRSCLLSDRVSDIFCHVLFYFRVVFRLSYTAERICAIKPPPVETILRPYLYLKSVLSALSVCRKSVIIIISINCISILSPSVSESTNRLSVKNRQCYGSNSPPIRAFWHQSILYKIMVAFFSLPIGPLFRQLAVSETDSPIIPIVKIEFCQQYQNRIILYGRTVLTLSSAKKYCWNTTTADKPAYCVVGPVVRVRWQKEVLRTPSVKTAVKISLCIYSIYRLIIQHLFQRLILNGLACLFRINRHKGPSLIRMAHIAEI